MAIENEQIEVCKMMIDKIDNFTLKQPIKDGMPLVKYIEEKLLKNQEFQELKDLITNRISSKAVGPKKLFIICNIDGCKAGLPDESKLQLHQKRFHGLDNHIV